MANDKDFKVKNGVQPTRYVEGLGTITAGTEGPDGIFSTTLYTGTGATQTITNNIDLATDGGLVWIKERSRNGTTHDLYDTARGVSQWMTTTGTYRSTAQGSGKGLTAFNSNGFTLGTNYNGTENSNGQSIVSWTFKKQSNFFDIVTFSGNSTNRTISHSLGEAPGFMIVKRTSGNGTNWMCFHRSVGATKGGILNGTNTFSTDSTTWNNTAPTDSVFSLGTDGNVNGSGHDYVAYLFGHNSTNIHCGTYTNSSSGVTVDLGFQPQWMMFKRTDATSNWSIVDVTRGITEVTTAGDNSNQLRANLTNAENTEYSPHVTPTGFKTVGAAGGGGGGSGTYIYIAIADVTNTDTLDLSTGSVFNYTPTASKTLKLSNPTAATGATLLLNTTDVAGITGNFSTTIYTGTGSSQDVTTGVDLSGSNEGLVWIKKRGDGSAYDHNLFDTVRGATKWLKSNDTDAEGTRSTGLSAFNSNGFTEGGSGWTGENGKNYVAWTFKYAPNFFDIVTWSGNGGGARNISHNLGSAPGMMIVRRYDGTEDWGVYHRRGNNGTNDEQYLAYLHNTQNFSDADYFNDTAPTSTQFTVGSGRNISGRNYIAYLFGHSDSGGSIQCGSYTGSSNTAQDITLGWRPQWILLKKSNAADDWRIFDTVRGDNKILEPNTSDSELSSSNWITPTSTGFTAGSSATDSANYIYLAIRAVDAPSTTYDSSFKWSGGTAPDSPAVGETDVVTINTTDGGTNYYASLAIDGAK